MQQDLDKPVHDSENLVNQGLHEGMHLSSIPPLPSGTGTSEMKTIKEFILRQRPPNELPKYVHSPRIMEVIKPDKPVVPTQISTFKLPTSSAATRSSDSTDVEISQSESEIINHPEYFDQSSTSESVSISTRYSLGTRQTQGPTKSIYLDNKTAKMSSTRKVSKFSSVNLSSRKILSNHSEQTQKSASSTKVTYQPEIYHEEEEDSADDGTYGHRLESSSDPEENETNQEKNNNTNNRYRQMPSNTPSNQPNGVQPNNTSTCCLLI